MVLAETIEVSENNTLYKNETITNDILETLKNEETLVDICVYKTKKYYNADFETPNDESLENEVSKKSNKKKFNVFETVSILDTKIMKDGKQIVIDGDGFTPAGTEI